MALKLNERYPARFDNPSADYPQGSFKNRTSPAAKDGSYLEKDWANDKEGFFQSLIAVAGIIPSGIADKVGASQYYDALLSVLYAAARKTPVLTDTGTAGAYAAANTPALTALPSTGYMQRVKIANANTGASTYAPDGLAAKPVYGLALQPLQGGELPAGVAVLMYLVQAGVNGGNGAWVIIESLGGAQQVSAAIKSSHAMQLGQATGRLINITSFTSSGTFTPNANTKMLRVRAVGGGGSGGYALATAAAQTSTGTGGDAGALGEIWVTSGIATTAVTVGGGGIGAAGGQSTFGTLLVCPGGAAGINGGAFSAPGQNVRTGALLQPTGTGIFVFKGAGAGGLNGISLSTSFAQGGTGAVSQYGAGGQGAINGVGGAAVGCGSGGGGAANLPSLGSQAGGNGAPGLVIVEEYS